jgi:hypothetical protein
VRENVKQWCHNGVTMALELCSSGHGDSTVGSVSKMLSRKGALGGARAALKSEREVLRW